MKSKHLNIPLSVLLVLSGLLCSAQDSSLPEIALQGEIAGPAEAGGSLTLNAIITQGGALMYVLLGLSVITLMLILFYLMTFHQGLLMPKKYLMRVEEAAQVGDAAGMLGGSDAYSSPNTSPLAQVINHAFGPIANEECPFSLEQCTSAMEEEGARQSARLWGRLQYLLDIATIAPMVGLLGTVWGMMVSFTGLESGLNMVNKADRLASGISQAMFTTFGGLIVGIIGMVAYALFRGRLNKIISNFERRCSLILRNYANAISTGKKK